MPTGVLYNKRFSFPPQAPASAAPPQERTGKAVYDDAGNKIGTDVGGNRIIPIKQDADARATFRSLEQQLHEVERNLANPKNTLLSTSPAIKAKIDDWTRQRDDLRQRLSRINPEAYPPAADNAPRGKSIAVPGQGTREDPARPTTQAQMDSVPEEAYYIDPGDGKTYRKKKKPK